MMRMNEKHYEEEEEEEEKTNSGCSSGCQSGWTMYLDPTSVPYTRVISIQQKQQQQQQQQQEEKEEEIEEEEDEEEEEEDLSMVSDASSGPPHFHEEEDDHGFCFSSSSNNNNTAALFAKKRKVQLQLQLQSEKKTHISKHSSSLLDDTASSPFLSLSKTSCNGSIVGEDALEQSCGFSANKKQFKEKHAMRKHPSSVGKEVSREEGEKKLW